ncbi:hypothetical protein DB30_03839 [Enhygromyxa salina]|uniref:HTH cro/C1-type domain-containing protein n=1 Tax=Enhygromyxa salina TaxID=215803 RepID=A0A0C2A775_9BACT|nr:helix-turn-helix transcriptional regulator [Enhygromyxa salina]KIG19283.1 hypothetical protein DB30_03839 [Enhygromyxa salina]
MIKNEREYRITRSQAESFEGALQQLGAKSAADDPIVSLQRRAMQSQLDDLIDELADYTALREGRVSVLRVSSFDELPTALIRARIAAGLTQKELAERLALAPQQVQRYEANDYATASLARIQQIARVLGVAVREEVFLPGVDVSMSALRGRLKKAGVDPTFFTRRLFNESADEENDAQTALRAGDVVSRIFGWSSVDIFAGSSPLKVATFAGAPRYKLPATAQATRTDVLTAYARFVAEIAVKGTPETSGDPIPTSASGLLRELGSPDSIRLSTLLDYLWSRGVPVVPLAESGGFHGAFWRINGRSAIVLKQKTASEARWMHDLLHEMYHVACHTEERDYEMLEGETGMHGAVDQKEEQRATKFAGNVLLGNRAEELAEESVRDCSGRLQWLKRSVPAVAKRNSVRVDVLANYMAYRLALQGENWWGAANNLQPPGSPWEDAREFLLGHVQTAMLESSERHLLRLALLDMGA